MQKIILTVAALGFIAIVVTVAPDVRPLHENAQHVKRWSWMHAD